MDPASLVSKAAEQMQTLVSKVKYPDDVERRMEQIRLFAHLATNRLCDLALTLAANKNVETQVILDLNYIKDLLGETIVHLTDAEELLLSSIVSSSEGEHDNLPPFEEEPEGISGPEQR